MYSRRIIARFFFLFGLIQFAFSQTNNSDQAYYTAFDSIVGQVNSSLFNGKRYVDKYRSTDDNHRFFWKSKFIKGDVTYYQQPFFNIDLKYDLFEDVLITKLPGEKNFFNMVFTTEHLKQFNIQGHHFINITSVGETSFKGFAEILYKGTEIVLLKKWFKDKSDRIVGQSVVHKFDVNFIFLVSFNGKLDVINSKSDLKKLIPDKSNEINSFYKEQKSVLKSDPDSFMKQLIIQLDNNIINGSNKDL